MIARRPHDANAKGRPVDLSPAEVARVTENISAAFRKADRNGDGLISKEELAQTFKSLGSWSKKQLDDLFKQALKDADRNKDGMLSYEEFVDWVFGVNIPQIHGSKVRYPVYQTREITYPNGVKVDFDELQQELTPYIIQLREAGLDFAKVLLTFAHSRDYNKKLHKYFVEADENENGTLSWNEKEITAFILHVLKKFGLPEPHWKDSVFYPLYQRFDLDESWSLSEFECLCMVDSVLRVLARAQQESDDSPDPH